MEENKIVRKAARSAGVPFWRIAERIGISEPTFTRWLRKPLSKEREEQILLAIRDLEQEE